MALVVKKKKPKTHLPTQETRDVGSIPVSERFPGGGPGKQLQYSWASLVAQTVKNPPAMWETRVRSLDWEDPLEEGMATYSSSLAWRIPIDRGAWWATVHRVSKSWTSLSDKAQHTKQELLFLPPTTQELKALKLFSP